MSISDVIESFGTVWRNEAHRFTKFRYFHLVRCGYVECECRHPRSTHTNTYSVCTLLCTFNIYVGLCGAFVVRTQHTVGSTQLHSHTLCLLFKTTIYFIYYILCLNNIIAHYAAFVELCARGDHRNHAIVFFLLANSMHTCTTRMSGSGFDGEWKKEE